MLVQKISSQLALAKNDPQKTRNEKMKMDSQPSFKSIPGLEANGTDPIAVAIAGIVALCTSIGAVAFIAALARRGKANKAVSSVAKTDWLSLGQREGNR